ncbi:MAG: multiprotein bridging factor aMBF1 [Candidatus Thermoplasmatota archaeon]|nr:multiprotein bridging factor aMBF1 [Candidatus Thermoplasmatota archaeon]
MPCEVCGKNTSTRRVVIDGVEMSVCVSCAKFGKESAPGQVAGASARAMIQQIMAKPTRSQDIYSKITDELVSDYGQRVREARIAKHLEIKDVGKAINEKHTVLLKIEEGSMRPNDELVKKLERLLEIKLKTTETPIAPQRTFGAASGMTLGDFIKVKKKD